ncbi:Uma2 family endonuclease [Phormidium sp. FACHB-1136]|uniref:Uma2 family endonuclease n=1 Tax=Phormidium sp. FACHB-1136 TaxID=2692848 RepID=UPI001685DE3A|nr:Uma2 family endonuclease [Phormidium sp. FACHB-1136]MBD2424640.1 Uma2 family endonuclease [Phormidium sp. FACHB-1136]
MALLAPRRRPPETKLRERLKVCSTTLTSVGALSRHVHPRRSANCRSISRFVPLCPDFAVGLKSPSDDLTDRQAKMQEYLDNGLQLGWLIDPEQRQVEIYRLGQPVECLTHPKTLSDETGLPGLK